MGAQERELTPWASPRHLLGAELRWWRHHRGLSLAELGAKVRVSGAMLGSVEKAERNATAKVITACDTTLATSGALSRLLAYVNSAPAPASARPSATIIIHFGDLVTDGDDSSVVVADGADSGGVGNGEVRQLDDARRRRRPAGR